MSSSVAKLGNTHLAYRTNASLCLSFFGFALNGPTPFFPRRVFAHVKTLSATSLVESSKEMYFYYLLEFRYIEYNCLGLNNFNFYRGCKKWSFYLSAFLIIKMFDYERIFLAYVLKNFLSLSFFVETKQVG